MGFSAEKSFSGLKMTQETKKNQDPAKSKLVSYQFLQLSESSLNSASFIFIASIH